MKILIQDGSPTNKDKGMLIKIQLAATVRSLIYFTAKSLYMYQVSRHTSSGVLKTVIRGK